MPRSSVDVPASMSTLSGAAPLGGVTLTRAVGGASGGGVGSLVTVRVLDVEALPPSASATVSVTTYVPGVG